MLGKKFKYNILIRFFLHLLKCRSHYYIFSFNFQKIYIIGIIMRLDIEINSDIFNDYIGLEIFYKFPNIILIYFILEIGQIEIWLGRIFFNLLN